MQVGVPQYTAQQVPTDTPVISPQVQALINARRQQVGAAGQQPVINPVMGGAGQPATGQLPPPQQTQPVAPQSGLSTAQQAILNYIQQHGIGTNNLGAINAQQQANNTLSNSFAAPQTTPTQVPAQQVPAMQVPGQVNGGVRTTQLPSPGVAQPPMQTLPTGPTGGLSQGAPNGLARYYMR